MRHELVSFSQGSVIREQHEHSCSQGEEDPGNQLTIRAQLSRTRGRELQRILPAFLRHKAKKQEQAAAPGPVFKWCSWTYGQRVWVEVPDDAGQDDQDLLKPSRH